MIIIKIDCCGCPQTLCGLNVWMSSDVMQAKGLELDLRVIRMGGNHLLVNQAVQQIPWRKEAMGSNIPDVL